MASDETISNRPFPPRPELGWDAWTSTVGYIATQHSPDAVLTLQAYGADSHMFWGATLRWGVNNEVMSDFPNYASALAALWQEIERQHVIFKSGEAAIRRPVNYADDKWLDAQSDETLIRLVRTVEKVFKDDWQVMLLYRPVESPENRIQARLLAENNTIQRAGRAGTLREACRTLLHNALPILTNNR